MTGSQFLQFSLLSTLLFITLFPNFLYAISTTTTMSRDQISCTMCDSCDNPCQPILSPPPPSLPPPSSSDSNCPPPPSSGDLYNSPPPPSTPSIPTFFYYSPPPPSPSAGGGGGSYNYPSPGSYDFSIPPPPNPIVPYFPYYYYNPPSSPKKSYSILLKSHPIAAAGIAILSFLIFIGIK